MICNKNRLIANGIVKDQSPKRSRKLLEHALILPILGKELVVWIFFALTAMTMAMPLCLWIHRSSDEDFFRMIRSMSLSGTAPSYFSSTAFQPLAALPVVSMDLPIKFAPASPDRSRAMAALSPSVSLLGQLTDTAPKTPVFHRSLSKYDDIITETARKYQVSPLLVKSIIQAESSFNPLAVSDRGAVGLMQVMPSTARAMGISELTDPKNNITAGVRYLKNLLILFDDDESLAIAAYNCGPEAMRRWGNTPPYPETQNFLRRVMSYYNFYMS